MSLPAYKVNVLWISDVRGWAYSRCFDGLSKVIQEKFPNLNFVQCFHDDVLRGDYDPNDYDVILLWAWINVMGPRSFGVTQILPRCPADRTILCVASEWAAEMLPFMSRQLKAYRYFAGANQRVTDILKKSFTWAHVENLEHGVDIDKFKPAPFPETFTVGWAGNQNAPNKRFTMAQQICRDAKVTMLVAGHKGTEKYLKPDDMPDWYNNISCLLITSVTEVHPLVYYEAASSGRPSVSTIVGDIGVERANGGIFFPVETDPSQFVDAIKSLRDNPAKLMHLGLRARMQAVKYWNWDAIAPKYTGYILMVKDHGV